MRICLSAPNTLTYPEGGHVWVFINWALGFRSLGHEVYWLDVPRTDASEEDNRKLLDTFRDRLRPFGLEDSVALCTEAGDPLPYESSLQVVPLEKALSADALCDHRYNLAHKVVARFRHSMMIDIDPGQFHVALDLGTYDLAPHTSYFTVGEWTKFTHKQPALFNTRGWQWHYTPPPVALDQWPVTPAPADAAFTTVSNWFMSDAWMPDSEGNWYDNSKRAAFQPYLDLPKTSPAPLELALNIGSYQPEVDLLHSHGWRVLRSEAVSDPQVYRQFLQNSLGEFSAAKPAYVKMKSGWLSDRTVCYMASGKPVIVEHTGESTLFAGDEGILRFTNAAEAQTALDKVMANYDHHAKVARAIAETHFDAKKVLKTILERAIA